MVLRNVACCRKKDILQFFIILTPQDLARHKPNQRIRAKPASCSTYPIPMGVYCYRSVPLVLYQPVSGSAILFPPFLHWPCAMITIVLVCPRLFAGAPIISPGPAPWFGSSIFTAWLTAVLGLPRADGSLGSHMCPAR